jgi:late competence protein required for DNA uptake (superfamily II DNA/RNA helicase)
MLSTLNLNPNEFAKICGSIGMKYNLETILNQKSNTQALDNNQQRELVFTFLQDLKLPKVGLKGQTPYNQKTKYTKTAILKALKKATSFASLYKTEIRSASTDDGKLILDLISSSNNAKNRSLLYPHIDILLNKKEQHVIKPEKLITKNPIKLDTWQSEFIDLVKAKKSVLCTGPTSGGKTFLSMIAIHYLLVESQTTYLMYVAPTFHLALQVYSNVAKTFPNLALSLCTDQVNSISDSAKVWIGTSRALLLSLETKKQDVAIGIIDEVHMVYEDSNLYHLLTHCCDQVLALSATVKDEEDLLSILSKQTGIKEIQSLHYHKRAVELEEIKYNNEYTHDAFFSLIQDMKKKDMLPGLFFSDSDYNCYDLYLSLVQWLEAKDGLEYASWHHIRKSYKKDVRDFLVKASEAKAKFAENKLPEREGINLETERNALISTIIRGIETEMKKLSENGDKNQVYYDLSREINDLESIKGETRWDIIIPCSGVGPKYRFGTSSKVFKIINSKSKGSEQYKIKHFAKTLAEAEGFVDYEVRDLIRLLARGAKYGVGMLLPTLPYVIQYHMMKLINEKKMPIVIASHSMSMGINSPFRSVIISSRDTIYREDQIAQMKGRAGRRGLDTKGYVIYFNIKSTLPCEPKLQTKEKITTLTKEDKDQLNQVITMIEKLRSKFTLEKEDKKQFILAHILCLKPILMKMGLLEELKIIADLLTNETKLEQSVDYHLSETANKVMLEIQRYHILLPASDSDLIKFLISAYNLLHKFSCKLLPY